MLITIKFIKYYYSALKKCAYFPSNFLSQNSTMTHFLAFFEKTFRQLVPNCTSSSAAALLFLVINIFILLSNRKLTPSSSSPPPLLPLNHRAIFLYNQQRQSDMLSPCWLAAVIETFSSSSWFRGIRRCWTIYLDNVHRSPSRRRPICLSSSS